MSEKTDFLKEIDKKAEQKKAQILNAKDELIVTGTRYFVSTNGCDDNDGLNEETPWKSLDKVSSFAFKKGDGVFFKRGDLFRGCVYAGG